MLRLIHTIALSLVSSIALVAAAAPLAAQQDILLQARAGAPPGDRFRVDSAGGFIALGVAKDAGGSSACAALVPTSGHRLAQLEAAVKTKQR